MKFYELVEEYEFVIPNYQRAYSWTEKEIELFIADIAEHTDMAEQAGNADKKPQYYLGHYILEEDENGHFSIVDGQQRLTTVKIFLAVCQSLKKSSTPPLSLSLDVVAYDNARFKELLSRSSLDAFLLNQEQRLPESTASLRRVVSAIQTLLESFLPDKKQHQQGLLSKSKIDAYIDVIREAAVSVGIYKNKAVAAQIFELHNTRGVLLTETEKVKALLMKYVYLNSTEGDRDVNEIQNAFAKAFELEERAADASFRGEMSLDDILAHHLRAIDDGKDKASFTRPQSVEGENGCLSYVRTKLKEFDNRESRIQYAKALASEFATSMELVSKKFVNQDKNEPLIGDVILLDQRRSMIFLLRYFRAMPNDEIADHLLLKRWESFLFLWDFHDIFYNMKHQRKESFEEIFKNLIPKECGQVAGLLGKYYSGETNFAHWPYKLRKRDDKGVDVEIAGLGEIFPAFITRLNIAESLLHRAYIWGHWHARYKYWLYKYEIDKASSDQANQVRTSLRKLFKDNEVTLDHIVPRELEWKELSRKAEADKPDNIIDGWEDTEDKMQAKEEWEHILKTIDGIGNLVLLSRSHNASLQNIAPYKRAADYRRLKLASVSYREVAEWKARKSWSDDNDPWHVRIESRGKRLIGWMVEYFTDKSTWTTK